MVWSWRGPEPPDFFLPRALSLHCIYPWKPFRAATSAQHLGKVELERPCKGNSSACQNSKHGREAGRLAGAQASSPCHPPATTPPGTEGPGSGSVSLGNRCLQEGTQGVAEQVSNTRVCILQGAAPPSKPTLVWKAQARCSPLPSANIGSQRSWESQWKRKVELIEKITKLFQREQK